MIRLNASLDIKVKKKNRLVMNWDKVQKNCLCFSTFVFPRITSSSSFVGDHLQTFFGVSSVLARVICAEQGISFQTRVKKISRMDWQKLLECMEREFFVDTELKRLIQTDLKRLSTVGCYRGLRHHEKLPSRGQRTHTNARTAKRFRNIKLTKS